jgi:hypothetical protein
LRCLYESCGEISLKYATLHYSILCLTLPVAERCYFNRNTRLNTSRLCYAIRCSVLSMSFIRYCTHAYEWN